MSATSPPIPVGQDTIDGFLYEVYCLVDAQRKALTTPVTAPYQHPPLTPSLIGNLHKGQLYDDLSLLLTVAQGEPDPSRAVEVTSAIHRVERASRLIGPVGFEWEQDTPIGTLVAAARQRVAAPDEYIPVSEAARRLGCNMSRIGYLVAYGQLVPVFNPFARSVQQGRRLFRASNIAVLAALPEPTRRGE